MAYYVYVPNSDESNAGTIIGSFDNADDAACEQALHGGRAAIIEAAKPSFRHLHAYVEKGWKKCQACGRPTPPWRQTQERTE